MLRIGARALRAAGTIVLLAVSGLLLFAHPRWSIGSLVGDDAGYYLGVSRNAALGYGFSFDRLHPTNGFNPLMTLILVSAYHVLPRGLPLLSCYRIGALVGILAVVGGLWAFLRTVSLLVTRDGELDDPSRFAMGAAFAFYAFFIATKSYYAMDAFLVLCLGGLYLRRVARLGINAAGRAAAVDGLLLGLVFLARVDSAVLLAASLGLGGLRVVVRREGLAALAIRAGVSALVVAPLFVWNISTFGTWMPISAGLKSAFPVLRLGDSVHAVLHTSLNVADLGGFALSYLVACVTVVGILRELVRGRGGPWLDPPRVGITLFTLYVLGRLSFMILFSRFDVQGGYAILAHTYLALMVLWAARRVSLYFTGPAGRRVMVLSVLVLALAGGVLLAGKCRTTWARWTLGERRGMVDDWTLGGEIRSRTAPDEVIYGGAFGLLGFFADRPWINGDGVANDFEYQQVLHRGALPDYLARNHVRYVSLLWPNGDPLPEGPIVLSVESQLYGGKATYRTSGRGVVLRASTYRDAAADVCLVRYAP